MTATPLKLGVLLPTRALVMRDEPPKDANPVLEMALRAEAAGLDSVWVGDSLSAKPRMEPLTTLAALATHTQRVRLGTAVLLGALRHPVLLAQMVGTLDLLSQGRAVLAVGAGGAFNEAQKQELRIAGVDPRQRGRRLEEVVQVLKALGTGHLESHQGRHFQLENVSMRPLPVQKGGVPVLFACHLRAKREAQFRRAARLGDGFISISEPPSEFAEVGRRVAKHAAEFGRDPAAMERVFYLTTNLNTNPAEAEREADEFIRLYYGVNIWRDLWGPWGPPERLAESIRAYESAGATTVIVRFASFRPLEQFQTFVDKVLPQFR